MGKNSDVPFEAILAEVTVEGENVVQSVMIDQGKAGAIDKAEVFVVVPQKNRLGRPVDCVADMKYFDVGLIEMLHEFDGSLVTDSEADQGIGLGEDKIGC